MKQLSLLDKRPLFAEDVLARFLKDHADQPIPNIAAHTQWLRNWTKQVTTIKNDKEVSLEQTFNTGFFCELLGYSLYPGDTQTCSAWPKPSTKITGLDREPDLILGNFASGVDGHEYLFEPVVVVELKRPGTILDAPQASYGNETPVEQAFSSASGLASCKWVIVTDMRTLRLYSVSERTAWEEFDLEETVIGPRTEEVIRQLWLLLQHDSLVVGGSDSTTSRLLLASEREQLNAQQGFYDIYAKIRLDLLRAIGGWTAEHLPDASEYDCILAAQRLLDRVIFIHFCEDHPDRLLQNHVLRKTVARAVAAPGPSTTKAYDDLRLFFRDLDTGVKTEFLDIPRYNGELFKYHPIVDEVQLPDTLVKKVYKAHGAGKSYTVTGVWGLDVFDFWRDLDRNLLGNIFERSIADIADLSGEHAHLEDGIEKKKAFAVYYTARRLARFLAGSAVRAIISESKTLQDSLSVVARSKNRLEFEKNLALLAESLQQLRVLDPACGSGAFLTAVLDELLSVYRKAVETTLRFGHDLTYQLSVASQSDILKSTIFGNDLLPQAVELAKLSLWLTSAKFNQPSADLSENILCADALAISLPTNENSGSYDLVIGNPPWGSRLDPDCVSTLEDNIDESLSGLDSWEVFLRIAYRMLKPGGRLCFVLPDTIFSVDKVNTRRFLLQNFEIEKWYSLGPDWFGPDVRMGTVVFQAKRRQVAGDHNYRAFVLAGRLRTKAIAGHVPLEQLEHALSHQNSQRRAMVSEDAEIQLGSSEYDFSLIDQLRNSGVSLEAITDRARGDELSADGLFWRCPSCNGHAVPGAKKKGGGYKPKTCPFCGLELTEICQQVWAVQDSPSDGDWQPFIDGRILNHRYENPTPRWINVGLEPVMPAFKDRELYRPPKVFLRQAGVGITATLSQDWARCPQSVYIYRINSNGKKDGYSEAFLLGVMASRVFNWLVLKSFGEVDPARAHVKLTHSRLASLPIPKITSEKDRKIAARIADLATKLVTSNEISGKTDWKIEMAVRDLWGISPEAGAYINGFYSTIPGSQAIKDLFPKGAPPPTAEPH